MKRVAFQFELSEEQLQQKKQQVQALLNSPYIIALHQKFPMIDAQFVFNHSAKLTDYDATMRKCEHCKGLAFCRQPNKGFVMELDFDQILVPRLSACKYQIAKEQAISFKNKFIEKDLGDQYFTIDLMKLDVSHEKDSYYSAYANTLQLLQEDNPWKGIYYCGRPGVGKTFLAAGFANYCVKNKQQKVAFVSVPKLIGDLKLLFHDSLSFEQKIARLIRADVLVLDDIGGENVSAWSRDEILLPILNKRMENHKLTLFTSNYSMEELEKRYEGGGKFNRESIAAERLCERIRALSKEITIIGESRRK